MKNIRSFSKYLAITTLAIAMVASAAAQQLVQSSAKVVRIKGEARYATQANVWQPLKVGDVLNAGTIIQTARDSRVDMVLGERNAAAQEAPKWGDVVSYQPEVEQDFVRVQENSVLVIDKLLVADTGADQIRETELNLRSGRIFGTVKKLSAASKYEIKIPNGIAGIRGTIYIIDALGTVGVMQGSVGLAYMDGAGNPVTQMVVGGQSFNIPTGQFSNIPEDMRRQGNEGQQASQTGHHGPPSPWPPEPQGHVSPTTGRPPGVPPTPPGPPNGD